MDLEEIKQTFITESSEILQKMEAILLQMESGSFTREMVHDLFRGFHTIKGSAGIFGYDNVVEFTHAVESLMDKVRNDEIQINKKIVSLLLECRDLISELIECIANNLPASVEADRQQQHLLSIIISVSNGKPIPETLESSNISESKVKQEVPIETKLFVEPEIPQTVKEDLVSKEPEEESATIEIQEKVTPSSNIWHISLRFTPEAFKDGFEPIAVIRYLNEIGKLMNVVTIPLFIPELDSMDPECCYLGFEIKLYFEGGFATLDSVFEFIKTDCKVYILPPKEFRDRDEYLNLLRSPCGQKKILLTKILLYMETLSRIELQEISKKKQSKKKLPVSSTVPKTENINLQTTQEVVSTVNSSQPTAEVFVEKEPIITTSIEPETLSPAKKTQIEVAKSTKTVSTEIKTIRVDARKLDQLINLVGELVIASAGIYQISTQLKDTNLTESSDRLSHLIGELRESALKIRMVPIGETFNRFHRTVRDIGMELGKEIKLEVNGGETELDKTVVEKINDPLMHIIRNAIDHGIESKEERIAAGKSPVGRLVFNAYHENGYIVIEVSDDGKGLNKERIFQKAIEKNIITENTQLTEAEIVNLIFRPGFSTAEKVTNISGRGVGLDVVKQNIESLRGTVTIESERGKGTIFKVRLPLTLAIIDGFLITLGTSYFVVPLDVVEECIEFNMGMVTSQNLDSINLRGEILPFIKLNELFNIHHNKDKRKNILVIRFAGKKAGLLVDSLQGEIQTVIKPLGEIFKNLKCISGSSILGNGEIALILDIPSLINNMSLINS